MTDGFGPQFVFGYGSLVPPGVGPAAALKPNVLRGYRRTWNVAMDNSHTIPGYKHYVDPSTGRRPRCFVVFLNIVPDANAHVNGAVFRVTGDELAQLDQRERNYDRIEVSPHLAEAVAGTVWTYVGSRAGIRRFEQGRRTRRAVISAAYEDAVRQGFAALGDDAAREFQSVTDAPPCPIVPLQRVSVPPR